MPELPDVEGFRAVLAGYGTARRVERVEVADAEALRDVSAGHLERSLRGHWLGDPGRHGKWLIATGDCCRTRHRLSPRQMEIVLAGGQIPLLSRSEGRQR